MVEAYHIRPAIHLKQICTYFINYPQNYSHKVNIVQKMAIIG